MANEQNNTFTPLVNDYKHFLSSLKDQHDIIFIENKTVNLKNIGKIVRGEAHSNILTFEINRFFDGEDLSTKGIQFILKNDNGILVEPSTNIEYNDDSIRFSYVTSRFCTSCKSVTIAIEIYRTIDEQDYSLKTLPFVLNIEDTLNSEDMNIITISDNLYVNLLNRINKLEEQNNGGSQLPDSGFENIPIDFVTLMEDVNEEAN